MLLCLKKKASFDKAALTNQANLKESEVTERCLDRGSDVCSGRIVRVCHIEYARVFAIFVQLIPRH